MRLSRVLSLIKIANFYAAMSGKVVHNVFVSQCYLQNRQFVGTQYRRDSCAPYVRNLLPFQGGKLAWTGISSMQLRTLSKHQGPFVNRRTVHCNGLFQTLIIQVDIKCETRISRHPQNTCCFLSCPACIGFCPFFFTRVFSFCYLNGLVCK